MNDLGVALRLARHAGADSGNRLAPRGGNVSAAIVALMMRTLVKLKRGAHTPEDRALDVFHAAAFTLDSPHRIDVGLDGEAYRLRPPLHFRFERHGVKVLCLVAP